VIACRGAEPGNTGLIFLTTSAFPLSHDWKMAEFSDKFFYLEEK
jgi:hypothetical protein